MTEIIRWEPFREMLSLRRAMDRLWDEAFSPLTHFEGWTSAPLIDMYQTEDKVVVKAALPGVKPDQINLSITGDVLTVRGEVEEEEKKEGATYYLRERRKGAFSRSISLPTSVNAEKAKAEFDNGVLTITLPKAEEVLPKTITVKAK